MNWWQRLWKKDQLERQLDAELRFHFERQVADNLRDGMTAAEARRKARLQFGGLEQLKEDCREERGTRWLENAVQDVRFALRMLRRSPGFASAAVLCLALGIGANTAIFGVMDALMLRMLPVSHPEQLVVLGEGHSIGVNDDFPHNSPDLFSQPFYREIRAKSDAFSDVAAVESSELNVHARFGGPGAALEPLKARLVSGNYFAMLGVPALAGRVLMPEDDRAPGAGAVAVLRYGYWTRRFARDPAIIGRTLSFNGTVFTIVGVASPEFFGTVVGAPADLWIPLSMQAPAQPWRDHPFDALTQSLWLIARRKPGVTVSAAQADANVRFQQWLHSIAGPSPSAERIGDMRKARIQLTDAARGLSRLRREFSRPLQILMVLVGLVLLIACANIANLLMARAASRRREMAVRVAVGAERRRLMVQLLSESLFLAFIGGGLGLLLSLAGGHLLLAMVSPGPNPVPLEAGPGSTVLLFTFGLSLLTGLIFGTVPALQMTKLDAGPSLKEGKGLARSQSHSRLSQMLVAGQVALAFFLIVGAALFATTLAKLEQTDTGFEKERVLTLRLDSDSSNAKGAALLNLFRRLDAQIHALPGVEAASFSELTFNEGHWRAYVWRQGVPQTEANAKSIDGDHVGAQYFQVLGIQVIAGRGFGPQDTLKSQPIAVVNETFAHTMYPNESALGRHFMLGAHDDFEIVGVVKDSKYESIRENPTPAFFLSNDQDRDPDGFSDLVIRTRQKPESIIGELRAAIHAENPNLAISNVMTLAEAVDRSLTEARLLAKLAGFFGALALLLAAIGLYGVIAYSVAGRTNEIGIRMALGARPISIVIDVLREFLFVVALGLAIGLPMALACGRLAASQLYGVTPGDPWLIAGAAAVLIVTALAAGFLPARRAAVLDPLIALREE